MLPRTPFSTRKLEQDKAFHIVIVYEDYVAGRTAMDTYELLLSRFDRELAFCISIWSFEMLQRVQDDSAAVHAAVDADAIIVATRQREDLPPAIKEWVGAWVSQKRAQPAVLIALFNFTAEPPGASFPTCDYLKSAAAAAGIDFLVQQTQPATFSELEIQPTLEGSGLND